VRNYRLEDPGLIEKVENALNQTSLSGWERKSPEVLQAVENEVFRRYNATLDYAVPWVMRQTKLDDKEIVEIGCGSGSSTAAFAHYVKHVHAYDIKEEFLNGARARAQALGLQNISFYCVSPQSLRDTLYLNHVHGTDIVLLFAVLEHCTPHECLEMLQTSWELLHPGGLLVVIETPNRLAYMDSHTSQLPFFHLLPGEIALRYYKNSPRSEFVSGVERSFSVSEEEGLLELIRLGKGVSYHEFQIALREPELNKLLIGDGYEKEMVEWFPVSLEERLLQTFFLNTDLRIPIGFARKTLNLIFCKPSNSSENVAQNDPLSTMTRLPYLTNYEQQRTSFIEENKLNTPLGFSRYMVNLIARKLYRTLRRVRNQSGR
jgi:2-polyprenyl-3-methyl-5-hydroxy-6-metoxy-1,4-benzoquinol methylase